MIVLGMQMASDKSYASEGSLHRLLWKFLTRTSGSTTCNCQIALGCQQWKAWGCLESSGTILGHPESGITSGQLGPSGAIWVQLEPSGHTWNQLGPSGAITCKCDRGSLDYIITLHVGHTVWITAVLQCVHGATSPVSCATSLVSQQFTHDCAGHANGK